MPRRTDYSLFAVALCATAIIGCGPPSPESIQLTSIDSASPSAGIVPPTKLAEGDLLVIEADPKDGVESMDLCVDASTSDPTLRVERLRGHCRRFVVIARGAGSGRVRFEARGTVSELVLDIASGK